jgi:hypothetical protein
MRLGTKVYYLRITSKANKVAGVCARPDAATRCDRRKLPALWRRRCSGTNQRHPRCFSASANRPATGLTRSGGEDMAPECVPGLVAGFAYWLRTKHGAGQQVNAKLLFLLLFLVGGAGFEPATPAV